MKRPAKLRETSASSKCDASYVHLPARQSGNFPGQILGIESRSFRRTWSSVHGVNYAYCITPTMVRNVVGL